MDDKKLKKYLLGVAQKIEDEITEDIKTSVRKIYGQLLIASPIWTGSYILSHRILFNEEVTKGPVIRIADPRAGKPDDGGALLGARKQLRKTDEFRLGDTIIIRNEVPHARIVEAGTPTRPAGGQYLQVQIELNEAI